MVGYPAAVNKCCI